MGVLVSLSLLVGVSFGVIDDDNEIEPDVEPLSRGLGIRVNVALEVEVNVGVLVSVDVSVAKDVGIVVALTRVLSLELADTLGMIPLADELTDTLNAVDDDGICETDSRTLGVDKTEGATVCDVILLEDGNKLSLKVEKEVIEGLPFVCDTRLLCETEALFVLCCDVETIIDSVG